MGFMENKNNVDLNEDGKPSKKKILYSVGKSLHTYLKHHGREVSLPILHKDLLNFTWSIPMKDKDGNYTHWEKAIYDKRDWDYLREGLVKIYAVLKTEGDLSFINHLDVERIDYCTFGNSLPFRIRIINKFNANYDHYYIKLTDAYAFMDWSWNIFFLPIELPSSHMAIL